MGNGKPSLKGEIVAEFLGTAVLIALGDGVVAMVTLFAAKDPVVTTGTASFEFGQMASGHVRGR